jgi:iron complex transport system substrate-binding protein
VLRSEGAVLLRRVVSELPVLGSMLQPGLLLVATVVLLVATCTPGDTKHIPVPDRPAAPERIVSLAPSITEILFALGLGDRVVGVTRYCDYPPEALSREQVGGYYDPNYEAIVGLRPDLVVLLPEHAEAREHLARLGVRTLAVDHRSVQGILASITAIGEVGGAEQQAGEIVADIEVRMIQVRRSVEVLPSPRVLICVGRNMGSGSLEDVCVAGNDGFYSEMLKLAGGVNAYSGRMAFPMVSTEGILRMNPEVIIDMVPDLEAGGWSERTIVDEWDTLSGVDAVRHGRVHVFNDDFVVIPGPRFVRVVEKIARTIHPEANWG